MIKVGVINFFKFIFGLPNFKKMYVLTRDRSRFSPGAGRERLPTTILCC